MFDAAVAAAHPAHCLVRHLPPPPARGKVIVLAAGKAAGSMAEVTERHYLKAGLSPARLTGLAVSRHGYGRPLQTIEMVEGGSSGAGRRRRRRNRTRAEARSGGHRRRSRARADVRRRVRELDRTRRRHHARRQARADETAARLRRPYRRIQHGAKASFPASRAGGSRCRPDARSSLLSRSPTCRATILRDRLGADRARSEHAFGFACDSSAAATSCRPLRSPRRSTTRGTNLRNPTIRFSGTANFTSSRGRWTLARGGGERRARSRTLCHRARRQCRGRSARGSRPRTRRKR